MPKARLTYPASGLLHAEWTTSGRPDGRGVYTSGDVEGVEAMVETTSCEPLGPVIIRAEGLVLREWRDGDRPAMVRLFDDPEIDRWTPLAHPFDATAARVYLERARERRERGTLQLAITQGDDRPLGEVLLFPTGVEGVCELGYMLGAEHRGRSLARRAISALMQYAAAWGYREARLTIAVGNTASEHVAHALDFEPTGEPDVREERKGRVLHLRSWRTTLA